MRVDLILLCDKSASDIEWPLGDVHVAAPQPATVQAIIDRVLSEGPEICFFWDLTLGPPDPSSAQRAISRPGHVWHAGLRLGTGGLPGLIDFVAPTWMLNRDPDASIEATSWRISLHACLIRTDVLRQLGGIDTRFQSLDGAALEMGHRFISKGVFVRHIPWLLPEHIEPRTIRLPLHDEFLFVRTRFKPWQFTWAAARVLLSRYAAPWHVARAWSKCAQYSIEAEKIAFHPEPELNAPHVTTNSRATVTVLIPTIDRYPYLRKVLSQLRDQTVAPAEIVVIDQTPTSARDDNIARDFADLPLKLIYLDTAGQCTSRNAGIQSSAGDYILFIDDDDEIGPDLVQRHLESMARFGSNVSCGIAHEDGAGALPYNFSIIRASDVFPTNNSMIKRNVLLHSGLFDLAYDRGSRADGDLGMRLYLSGQLMVLNPEISVFHHHAPRGGLRTHKARAITYASSRTNLFHRHLPSVSEIYLAKRYFSERQVRESLWLRAFGTFAQRGSKTRKVLKSLIAITLLPDTWMKIRQHTHQAEQLLETYPQIPQLEPQLND